MGDGNGRQRRFPRLGSGWIRVALAIAVLVAVLAVVVWTERRAVQTTPPGTASKPSLEEKARKDLPAPAGGARDSSRDRPERERSGR